VVAERPRKRGLCWVRKYRSTVDTLMASNWLRSSSKAAPERRLREKSGRPGSNRRQPVWKAGTYETSLFSHKLALGDTSGKLLISETRKAKDVALSCKHIFLGRMSLEEQDRMSACLPSHYTRFLRILQEVFSKEENDRRKSWLMKARMGRGHAGIWRKVEEVCLYLT
jgi:hypothetical protein